jgi:hypothetical protein
MFFWQFINLRIRKGKTRKGRRGSIKPNFYNVQNIRYRRYTWLQ